MSLLVRLLYSVGLAPWEKMATQAAGEQVSAMFDREEEDREPPYEKALDLGCGSGIWSVELAKRGWDVTGIDIVPKAVRNAKERAREAGVEARFLQADVTALGELGVGRDYQLVLDFGTIHGLDAAQRDRVGRDVTDITTDDATLLMYAVDYSGRPPFPGGLSREDIATTYPGWTIVDEQEFDASGLPGIFAKRNPRWYRLRRE